MPGKDEIERRCALTHEVKPAADLIRFVVGPDDVLVPDTDARAEGRGVWISVGETFVAEAVRKKAFAKSLKTAVTVPDDLPALTRLRLEQRFVSSLQMAKKAGQLLTGMTRVKAALESGTALALLTATDAAGDGRKKLLATLTAATRSAEEQGLGGPEVRHFELLDSAQLGLALGIENVIHAAPTQGPAGEAAVKRAEKLARYVAN
ncbi:MAG TPA: RNA-binding protein [Devosia sp.]|nr:RNA-binding protein [Devosia sp.]